MGEPSVNRYKSIIERIFKERYKRGSTAVSFERSDIESAAKALGIMSPKNLGDLVYSLRYRVGMPESIEKTQPKGMEWIIVGRGRAKYEMQLVKVNRIRPNPDLQAIKIPDATPEIVAHNALTDEQALLAKVRYNRLIDIFLGMAAYSLQNHLRTTVKGIGQIEIDEIYIGVDKHGRQYVIPVQAKGGSDQLGSVQTTQDIHCCAEKFPGLICRSISTQFLSDSQIALFELTLQEDRLKIVEEKHYHLVPGDQITREEIDA